jgi:hypothetical protein
MTREDNRREAFTKLRAEVDGEDGAMWITELRLRQAHGSGRFSDRIAAEIEGDYLPRVGLRLWPGQRLEHNQTHQVLIFAEDSALGNVLKWTRKPNRMTLKKLKRAITIDDSETLAKVRALVRE